MPQRNQWVSHPPTNAGITSFRAANAFERLIIDGQLISFINPFLTLPTCPTVRFSRIETERLKVGQEQSRNRCLLTDWFVHLSTL